MKTIRLIVFLLALTTVGSGASAATRNGVDCAVTAETVDAGGKRASSATCVNDGSIGGIGGISAVAAPAQTARHSYIGQLYDAAALVLSANPTNFNEGSALQLAARAVCDDGSIVPLPPNSVHWSVVSGPLASVDAAGLATADVVFQNTVATAGGSYLGKAATLGLQVMDVNDDNYRSYAGDNLPDGWQVGYFGIGNSNAAPGTDADNDGQSNFFEYLANTTPTDATSLFRLRIEQVTGQPNRKNLIFSPREPGRTYTPVFRANVVGGSWTPLTMTLANDISNERIVTDLAATNTAGFYRVQISLP